MKKFSLLLIATLISGAVFADNLYQSNNPFPQTSPQTMNNIYESKPDVIKKEETKTKRSWFRRNSNKQQEISQPSDYVIPESKVINEGVNDGSFYVFK